MTQSGGTEGWDSLTRGATLAMIPTPWMDGRNLLRASDPTTALVLAAMIFRTGMNLKQGRLLLN